MRKGRRRRYIQMHKNGEESLKYDKAVNTGTKEMDKNKRYPKFRKSRKNQFKKNLEKDIMIKHSKILKK